MALWNALRRRPRRSPRNSKSSNRSRSSRWIEPLESKCLLATDTFLEFNLASSQGGAALVGNPSLVGAWGIASSPGASGAFSVSGALAQRSSSLSGDVAGGAFSANSGQVSVPMPTGQVYNSNATEFLLSPPSTGTSTAAATTEPAQYLYASLDGTIYGFNSQIDPQHAVPAVSVANAVFTGLTIANNGTADQLYAADSRGGNIDVFDTQFKQVTTSGSFTDPNLPAGAKLFNVESLGGKLYVTYVSLPVLDPPGPLNVSSLTFVLPPTGGVVDSFDANGNFLSRIAAGSPLDAPWGMALGPSSFGQFAGDLLIANHGDGKINAFDPSTGALIGTLSGADGNPFVMPGLLGLSVGSGDATAGSGAGDPGALYFTTGGAFNLPILPATSPSNQPIWPLTSEFVVPTFLQGSFGTIQVATSDPLTAVGTNAQATIGQTFAGALAAFGSADTPSPTAGATPAATYTASIDWGDGGSTSAGSVVATGNGGFVVLGTHVYSAAGTEKYQVTIQDTSGNTATAAGTIQLASPPLVAIGVGVQSTSTAVAGATVADFFDTGGADPLTNYSATIDWGDGTSATAGTIVNASSGGFLTGSLALPAAFAVTGSHTYTATGDYTLTITIADTDGSQATVESHAHIARATLLAKGVPVTSQSLTVNGAELADFIDTGGGDPLTNFSATIDWGDGTSASASTIASSFDHFVVLGSHTYAAAGDYTLSVSITDSDGTQATAASMASVASASLAARGVPVESPALAVNGAVAAVFHDTGGPDLLTNYSATIDWGDGSSASAASVVGLLGYNAVVGSHTYSSSGDYKLTITITDSDGVNATVTSTVVTGLASMEVAPLLESGVPVVVTNGLAVNGSIVAAFADAGGGDPAANYAATIDWGDNGSTSAGTVGGSGNSFTVSGSHSYAASGVYDVKIAVTDADGSAADVTTHAYVDVSSASFVTSAFQDILQRPVDDAGLDYWTQQIVAGSVAPAQVASDLTHSAESYATNVINPLYQQFLGRPSDPGGVAYWTSQMQQGMTDQQLQASFIGSAEFYARAGGTNAAWVNAMYQSVLGRGADSAGLSYWTSQLAAGASRSSVATGFAASQERESQIVQDDYFTYLGRSASATEVSYWVSQFEQGTTNEDIVAGFIGSPEYVKLHS
jgi:uncharacterized protein (TIGR03118 family)